MSRSSQFSGWMVSCPTPGLYDCLELLPTHHHWEQVLAYGVRDAKWGLTTMVPESAEDSKRQSMGTVTVPVMAID